MAENIPNAPGGALPPKKETGKVQPKKETVRINLPPKPSAAPTIKLPTLPPGGPSGAAAAAAPAPAFSTAAAPAPRAAAAPAPRAVAAPTAAAAPRPAPAPVVVAQGPSGLDVGLAIAAAVMGLAALGSTVYMWQILGW
jgi:hypothetical protein